MSLPLRIMPRAQDDLQEIRDYYDLVQPALGLRFKNAMDSVLEKIRWNPKLFAAGYRGVRAGMHPKFPHIVRYRLLDDAVEIFAVTHGKRRASAWTSRLP